MAWIGVPKHRALEIDGELHPSAYVLGCKQGTSFRWSPLEPPVMADVADRLATDFDTSVLLDLTRERLTRQSALASREISYSHP
jgi:hypothetical protein